MPYRPRAGLSSLQMPPRRASPSVHGGFHPRRVRAAPVAVDDRPSVGYQRLVDEQYVAMVKGGRLVLDVPTDLPDGTELVLVAFGEDTLPDQGEELDRLISQVRETTQPD